MRNKKTFIICTIIGCFILLLLSVIGGFLFYFSIEEIDKNLETQNLEIPIKSTQNKFTTSALSLISEFDADLPEDKSSLNQFETKRLIVQSSEKLDFSEYEALDIISAEDNLYIIQFASTEQAEQICSLLQKSENVVYCEPDIYLSINTQKNANFKNGPMSWGVKKMGLQNLANSISSDDNHVTVAVVDTGVYSKHSVLSGRILTTGYDFVNDDSDPEDENQHGTHVSGTIIDGTPNLPIDILPIRCLDRNGWGTSIQIGLAIRYAANAGADIINLSLGTNNGTNQYVDQAVLYAYHKGCVVVASAGNDNTDSLNTSPAHLDECFVVSAVNSNLEKASFSNWGSSIDFAAPGVGILSTVPKFFLDKPLRDSQIELDGTSMAAPHISALAAMIKLQNPTFTPNDIHKKIQTYCTDLGEEGWDNTFGYGFPNWSPSVELLPTQPTSDSKFDSKIYTPILAEYTVLKNSCFNTSLTNAVKYANSGVWNFTDYSDISVDYMITDLAHDGIPELLIAFTDSYNTHFIMDIFSVDSGNIQSVLDNDNSIGCRSFYYLKKNGQIYAYTNGGCLDETVSVYSLPNNSCKLQLQEEYVYAGWDGDSFLHIKDEKKQDISEQQYNLACSVADYNEKEWIHID